MYDVSNLIKELSWNFIPWPLSRHLPSLLERLQLVRSCTRILGPSRQPMTTGSSWARRRLPARCPSPTSVLVHGRSGSGSCSTIRVTSLATCLRPPSVWRVRSLAGMCCSTVFPSSPMSRTCQAGVSIRAFCWRSTTFRLGFSRCTSVVWTSMQRVHPDRPTSLGLSLSPPCPSPAHLPLPASPCLASVQRADVVWTPLDQEGAFVDSLAMCILGGEEAMVYTSSPPFSIQIEIF